MAEKSCKIEITGLEPAGRTTGGCWRIADIQIDGLTFHTERKKIRNVWFRVRDGRIFISMPERLSLDALAKIIEERMDWIRATLAKHPRPPWLAPGKTIHLWGKPLLLEWVPGPESLELGADRLKLSLPKKPTHEFLVQLLTAIHKEAILMEAPALVEHWRSEMGLPGAAIRARKMRSRWGSCIPAKKSITLNTDLAVKPPECLELIIVHELCHFFRQKHDAGFYEILARHLPHWRELEELLLKSPSNPV